MKKLKLQRPLPIEVTLDDGRVFIVQPATRERVRAAVALDEAEEENASADDVRAGAALKLEALIGPEVAVLTDGRAQMQPSGPLLATLTPAEESQLLWAVWGQATGHDPATSVAVLKKKGLFEALLATVSNSSTGKPHDSETTCAAA